MLESMASITTLLTLLVLLSSPTSTSRAGTNQIDASLKQSNTKSSPIERPSTCIDSQINKYIEKLGTPKLTNSEFESLIECGSSAIQMLKVVLNRKDSNARASAAYALGEIGISQQNRDAIRIIREHELNEKNSDVLKVMQSYVLGKRKFLGRATTYVARIQSQSSVSSPYICSLPGIHKILPRCWQPINKK
jgi:hypothetical protein